MNEEFVKKIYETLVEEGCNIYKSLYNNTKISEHTVTYWIKALKLMILVRKMNNKMNF